MLLRCLVVCFFFFFFFFNDTATTEIYTLSLHDALPISSGYRRRDSDRPPRPGHAPACPATVADRKSTRLNSSHGYISYAVFCLKKKKNYRRHHSDSNKSMIHKVCLVTEYYNS